jgi:PST family polysaccharide transporter
MIARADRRDWLEPAPLRRTTARSLLAFGMPVWIGGVANFATRKWDNLLVSRFFGPAVLADYNLAYNLAEIPASQVGEQIGDVLLPSFARMPAEQRASALVRSTGLLALIMFPLAIGLGAVAPTVVATVFDARWAGVAPLLAALSALAITRPIGWTVGSYLQALGRPRLMMMLEVLTVVAMVCGLATFGRIGPVAACVAVGVAFAVRAVACFVVVRIVDGTPIVRLLAPFVVPLVACVAIVVAVWGVRYGLEHAGVTARGLPLAAECIAGAIAYVVAVFAIAPARSREFIGHIKRALARTRGARGSE